MEEPKVAFSSRMTLAAFAAGLLMGAAVVLGWLRWGLP